MHTSFCIFMDTNFFLGYAFSKMKLFASSAIIQKLPYIKFWTGWLSNLQELFFPEILWLKVWKTIQPVSLEFDCWMIDLIMDNCCIISECIIPLWKKLNSTLEGTKLISTSFRTWALTPTGCTFKSVVNVFFFFVMDGRAQFSKKVYNN